MERWPQDWIKTFDEISETMEKFFQDASAGIAEVTQAFTDLSETLVEQAQEAIAIEFEQFLDQLDDWISPSVQVFIGFDLTEGDFLDFTGFPVEPSLTEHPACIGCAHYHGHIYNGNLLVCGMHPYGWESGDCPDWSSK